MTMEGLIESAPWATTLAAIARLHPTAEVVIEAGGDKRYRIAFADGAVVGATSPLPNDSAVRIANVNHFVPRTLVSDLAKRASTAAGVDELDLVVEMAGLTPDQTEALWRLILAQRASRTFSIDAGHYVVSRDITLRRMADVAVDIGPVIYQGSRLNVAEDRLAAHLRSAGTYFVMRPDADLARFGFDDEVQPLIDELSRGSSLPELEAKHRDIDPRTLRALLSTLVACEQCEAFFEAAITPPVLLLEQPVIAFKQLDGGAYSDRPAAREVVAEPIQYRVALPTPPSAPPATPRTTTADAEAGDEAFQRGLAALRAERLNEAIFELELAHEMSPQVIDYLTYLAWARFCAAEDKQVALEQAREAFMSSIQHSPTPILGWFLLARAERMVGDDRDALRHFQAVLEIDPHHADAAAEIRELEARLES